MELKNLKTVSLNSSVQEQVKLHIVTAGLKAGDMLPTEKVLEQALGISRTSIREALRSLEALGIVESRQGKGRFLREFNYDAILANLSYNIAVNVKDFWDVIEVRIALESSFLERVVPAFTNREVAELYEILGRMESEVIEGVAEQDLINTHTEFHLKLYERTGNQLLIHLISIFATLQRTLTMLKRYRTSDTREFIELHRRLIQAVEQRDPVLAKRRLLEHFKDVIEWSETHRDGTL